MKRVTIPMGDGLVQSALQSALTNIESMMSKVDGSLLSLSSKEELNNMHFDYLGLIGIFSGKYKVTIEISEEDFNTFSGNHSVDFPNYDNLEVVDIEAPKQVLSKEDSIEENNLLIAEFMGAEVHLAMVVFPDLKIDDDGSGSAGGIITNNRHKSDLHYHSDYRWIMPVYEKINGLLNEGEETLYTMTIGPDRCVVWDHTNNEEFIENTHGGTDVEMIYLTVVEFIRKYNEVTKGV